MDHQTCRKEDEHQKHLIVHQEEILGQGLVMGVSRGGGKEGARDKYGEKEG